MIRRIISFILIVTFTLTSVVSPSSAQVASSLLTSSSGLTRGSAFSEIPASAGMTTSPVFNGIKIYPQEPFRFDFIVADNESVGADSRPPSIKRAHSGAPLQDEYLKLIKYFMASLTVPEGDLWVNLSPYEPDRIVPQALGQTEMGRDLLAQDYILKQLTASLMSPEGESGKKFWERVYEKIYEVRNSPQPPLYIKRGSAQRGGVTDNTTPTDDAQRTTDEIIQSFNKVWIVPAKVEVYQNGDVAYITKATLKVMLEAEYCGAVGAGPRACPDQGDHRGSPLRNDAQSIIRSTIIPLIEEEVNNGESFANLRQIFHSMILAKWYEQHFKNSVLGQSYIDRNVTEGIAYEKVTSNEERETGTKNDITHYALPVSRYQNINDIYNQYVAAFKSGAADLIKEEYDPVTQTVVPRKYFIGGIEGRMNIQAAKFSPAMLSSVAQDIRVALSPDVAEDVLNPAMLDSGIKIRDKNIQQAYLGNFVLAKEVTGLPVNISFKSFWNGLLKFVNVRDKHMTEALKSSTVMLAGSASYLQGTGYELEAGDLDFRIYSQYSYVISKKIIEDYLKSLGVKDDSIAVEVINYHSLLNDDTYIYFPMDRVVYNPRKMEKLLTRLGRDRILSEWMKGYKRITLDLLLREDFSVRKFKYYKRLYLLGLLNGQDPQNLSALMEEYMRLKSEKPDSINENDWIKKNGTSFNENFKRAEKIDGLIVMKHLSEAFVRSEQSEDYAMLFWDGDGDPWKPVPKSKWGDTRKRFDHIQEVKGNILLRKAVLAHVIIFLVIAFVLYQVWPTDEKSGENRRERIEQLKKNNNVHRADTTHQSKKVFVDEGSDQAMMTKEKARTLLLFSRVMAVISAILVGSISIIDTFQLHGFWLFPVQFFCIYVLVIMATRDGLLDGTMPYLKLLKATSQGRAIWARLIQDRILDDVPPMDIYLGPKVIASIPLSAVRLNRKVILEDKEYHVREMVRDYNERLNSNIKFEDVWAVLKKLEEERGQPAKDKAFKLNHEMPFNPIASLDDDLYAFVTDFLQERYSQWGLPTELAENIMKTLKAYSNDLDRAKDMIYKYVIDFPYHPSVDDAGDLGSAQKMKVLWQKAYGKYKAEVKYEDSYQQIAPYLENLSPGARILDIGAGKNDLGKVIVDKHLGFQVDGMDFGKADAAHQQERLRYFQQTKATAIPKEIHLNKYDVIIMNATAHHLNDEVFDALLKQQIKLLKEGGEIILIEDGYSPNVEKYQLRFSNPLNQRFQQMIQKNPDSAVKFFAFIDWYANFVVHDSPMPVPFKFRSIEEWEKLYMSKGFELSDAVQFGFPEKGFHKPSLAVMVFKYDPVITESVESLFNYQNQTWVGNTMKFSDLYIKLFLGLVNPQHPMVPQGWQPEPGVSLVTFVNGLKNNPELRQLRSLIENDDLLKNKITFMDDNKLHFTIASGLQREDFESIQEALSGQNSFEVSVNGLWMPSFMPGRIFLKTYMRESHEGKSHGSVLREKLGVEDYRVFPIGWIQFKEELNEAETKRLNKILDANQGIDFGTYKISKSILGSHRDSLLNEWDEIGEVSYDQAMLLDRDVQINQIQRIKQEKNIDLVIIAGPSASGKTTAGQYLASKGFDIIETDAFTRSPQVLPGQIVAQLKNAFGEEVIAPQGGVNYGVIFTSRERMDQYDAIMGSFRRQKIIEMLKAKKNFLNHVVFIDSAYFYALDIDEVADHFWLFERDKDKRLQGMIERDKNIGSTEEEARTVFQHIQEFEWTVEKYQERYRQDQRVVFINNRTLEDLYRNLDAQLRFLMQRQDQSIKAVFDIREAEEDHLGELYSLFKLGQPQAVESASDMLFDKIHTDVGPSINPLDWVVASIGGLGVPNSGFLLAAAIAQRLELPHRVLRIDQGMQQNYSGLATQRERESASRGNYRLGRDHYVEEKNVIFIDDGVMTGTTFKEGTRVLQEAGAQMVIRYAFVHFHAVEGDNRFESRMNQKAMEKNGLQPLVDVLNDPNAVFTTRLVYYSLNLHSEDLKGLLAQLSLTAKLNLYLDAVKYFQSRIPEVVDFLVDDIKKSSGVLFPDSGDWQAVQSKDFFENLSDVLEQFRYPFPVGEIGRIAGELNQFIESERAGRVYKDNPDKAMMNPDAQAPGGIDLNNLNMQTSGQANTIQMPADKAMMNGAAMPFKTLTPRIISVGTVQLGVFLGLNKEQPDSGDPSELQHEMAAIKEDT